MQASTQEKQRFLRQQIIESNFDPQQFINFIKSDLDIQELDVEGMEMQTLQSIVLKFKQYKFYLRESQNFTEGDPKTAKRKKIQYEKNGIFDYQFEEHSKCVQIEPFSTKLEIYVPNVEVIDKAGIFFTTTEVWFVIKANLNKHSIKRIAEDFQWLSNTVRKLYPLLAVPQLVQESKQNEGNYEKRRKQLEEYLQILGSRNQMRRSTLLHQFLTFLPEKMQKMKKNYDSMSFVRNIHSLKNESGSLNISLNNKLRHFCLSTESFVRKLPKIHETISDSISKVTELLDSTSKEIYKIVDSFAQLHELYNQITNKSPQYKRNEYSQILININNLYHTIANDLVTRSNTITSCHKEYSKIQLNYDKIMNQIFRDMYVGEKEYVGMKANLNRKKERLYPDITKWEVDQKVIENRRLNQEEAFELMLPRDTNTVVQNKKWLAYLYCNYRYLISYERDEFQNFLNFQTKRYSQVYCTFCSELLLNNKTYVEQVTKFIEETQKLSQT